MKDQQQTTGDIMCDRCGHKEDVEIESQAELASKDDAQRLAQGMFTALKRHFGRQGWYTSVGYDLCRDCCRAEGRTPGYSETGRVPDTSVQRREEREQ